MVEGWPQASIAAVTTYDAPVETDIAAYRAAGAAGVGLWECKLREGRDEEVLDLLRQSGLRATLCCPNVPSVFADAYFGEPQDPADRVEAMCAAVHRWARFDPVAVLCVTGDPRGRDPVEMHRVTVDGLRTVARVAADVVASISGGRGADVSIEASGAPAALQSAIRVTGREGTIVAVSFFGSRPVPLLLSPELHYRRQRLVSSHVSSLGSGLQPRWTFERRTAVAFELLGTPWLRTEVSHRFAFEDAPRAYRLLDEAPETATGVLLVYRPPGAAGGC